MNPKVKMIHMTRKSGEGHIASSFSIYDILDVLYSKILRPGIDKFVLSKGHASLALFTVLAEHGYLSKEELDTYCSADSRLGGHPVRGVPGVECSSGSLGHGLPMAVGMAFARKVKKSDGHVYCLIGDGEANEGSVWESFLLADEHDLDNLTIILDYNHSGDRALKLKNIVYKLSSFGMAVQNVNGHSHSELLTALNFRLEGQPTIVLAHTIKGKGCKSIENNPAWHHRIPTDEEVSTMTQELECENNSSKP